MMDLQKSSNEGGPPVLKEERAESPAPSGVSMKSEASMHYPPDLSSEPVTSDPKEKNISFSRDKVEHIFKELQQKFISLVKNELNTFKKLLSRAAALHTQTTQPALGLNHFAVAGSQID